ncbi:PWWP domain-containing DNA repair factor 3B-like [Myripristis murdjan]|uniref:PWWP domain-containing DNA repair factor 3B-like n=1 Tax=Myripristis murdjan TaxID=586833 RepID=A0A668AIL2_9TELE|nr:PWWP domain-containing DNA repair factor 3B-like [Myripristis murdjan]
MKCPGTLLNSRPVFSVTRRHKLMQRMEGVTRKSRKRKAKKMPVKKMNPQMASSPATDASSALSQSPPSPLASTPKRRSGRIQLMQELCLTPTSVHSSSADTPFTVLKSPPRARKEKLERTVSTRQLKASEMHLPCSTPKTQSRLGKRCAAQTGRLRKRLSREQTQSCHENSVPPAKVQHRKRQKVEEGAKPKEATTQPPIRCRPRFELLEPEAIDQDDAELSSELSIELSHYEDQLASFSIQEDEEEEEENEEELPSFLMRVNKKPITEGVFVWCKFRNYPFWPAMVKSVYPKMKKASILFIDDQLIGKKSKGLTVALKPLKPFDCEEANQLVSKAKENYSAAIQWSIDLINDYRIRIACGSFTGSFIEYFAHDMSYPVRRTYPQAVSERIIIASEMVMEERCDDHKEENSTVLKEEVNKSSKRLLPDRTHAAHNRASEKLVHFIVKQRMVESHLLAVISGQQQSRWLRSFLNTKRRHVVNVYLEDDEQLDQVYSYLNELYQRAPVTAPCLASMQFMQRVAFVLDVLLPEAIIYAIAGVDKLSIENAEEKYLKGRSISNREREQFDRMIEQQMKRKSVHQNTTHSHSTFHLGPCSTIPDFQFVEG